MLPKVSLSYQLENGHLLYGSYALGYEPGGFNATGDSVGEPYDSEDVGAFEIGLKGTILEGTGNFSLAAFYNDYSDRQFEDTVLSLDGNVVEIIRNIGDTTTYGLEAELTYLVNEAVSIGAAVGWTDAEWEGDAFFGGNSVKGLTPPNTPEFTGTAFVDASWPILDNGFNLNVRADFSYQGKRYWDIANDFESSSYSLLNLRLGIASINERWEVAVRGQNLLDEEYWTEAFPNIQGEPDATGLCGGFGCHLALLGQPRSYTVTLRYNF